MSTMRAGLRRRAARRSAFLAVIAAAALAPLAGASPASSQTPSGARADKPVIALSNSFLGNSWRQTMVKIFERTAKDAQSKGLISGYKVENTTDNTATAQIAQIKSLILQHVDAILIDSASPSALNPTIEQACRAGIKVVVFDSLASAPCEYNLEDSIYEYGYQEAEYVAKGMHGSGNVIIARGVVGSAPEAIIYKGQRAALKKFPKIKIVATVVGQASDPITQKAIAGVLPSLPAVKGVITGGSSFGAVQAFQAAGRPLPVVAFDNSGEALSFWTKQHAKKGYDAVSLRTEPGQVAAAFWEAMDLLDGKSVPKMLVFPNLIVQPKTLSRWTKVTPPGTVCHYDWTKSQFESEVARIKAHKPLLVPPPPTKRL